MKDTKTHKNNNTENVGQNWEGVSGIIEVQNHQRLVPTAFM